MPNYVVVKNKRDKLQELMHRVLRAVPLMSVTGGGSLDSADILRIICGDLHDLLDERPSSQYVPL